MSESVRNVLVIFVLFLAYSIFSNPQMYISLSRKRFISYKFFNLRLRNFSYEKPRHLNKVFILIPILREVFQITFRSQNIRKFLKSLTNNNSLQYESIYTRIVKQRFNPKYPYLTSGDHFSSFYPRNLGLFYSQALIPENTLNLLDYQNRLTTYLNSLHFCLEFFENQKITTTIVPIFRSIFYSANIYREPSDSLLSIMLSLDRLINPRGYNYQTPDVQYQSSQDQASKFGLELLEEYKLDLYAKILDLLAKINLNESLFDKKYSFSGIRDGIIRYQCFYDNICLWKTLKLAIKLEIISTNELEEFETLSSISKNIRKKFINLIIYDTDKKDLSADFLIAYSVGFLKTGNQDEAKILLATIKEFDKNKLIHPLGIQYSNINSPQTQWLVKLICPSYMGKSIWSHWSVELGMLCLDLVRDKNTNQISNDDINYLLEIVKNITKNTDKKILQYQGYPELYNSQGKIFSNLFYSSILQTGWIVNYNWLKINLKKL